MLYVLRCLPKQPLQELLQEVLSERPHTQPQTWQELFYSSYDPCEAPAGDGDQDAPRPPSRVAAAILWREGERARGARGGVATGKSGAWPRAGRARPPARRKARGEAVAGGESRPGRARRGDVTMAMVAAQ